jgi:hypothetical protein
MPVGVVTVPYKFWTPREFVECSCCGLPTDRPDGGLSVFCPDCVTEIKETVARESRSSLRSQYGGAEVPGGRRGP